MQFVTDSSENSTPKPRFANRLHSKALVAKKRIPSADKSRAQRKTYSLPLVSGPRARCIPARRLFPILRVRLASPRFPPAHLQQECIQTYRVQLGSVPIYSSYSKA